MSFGEFHLTSDGRQFSKSLYTPNLATSAFQLGSFVSQAGNTSSDRFDGQVFLSRQEDDELPRRSVQTRAFRPSSLPSGLHCQPSVVRHVRAALWPGIKAIMGSMSKFEREALMKGMLTSEHEAERVLLRALWKDFDRQRYKGA